MGGGRRVACMFLVVGLSSVHAYSASYPCHEDICSSDQYCDNVKKKCRDCLEVQYNCFTQFMVNNCSVWCKDLAFETERVKDCQLPSPIANGRVETTKSSLRHNASVAIVCDNGYYSEVDYMVCRDFGHLSPTGLYCKGIMCREPPAIANGQWGVKTHDVVSNGTYEYNTKAILTCNEGYLGRGQMTVTCGLTGTWISGTYMPVCEEDSFDWKNSFIVAVIIFVLAFGICIVLLVLCLNRRKLNSGSRGSSTDTIDEEKQPFMPEAETTMTGPFPRDMQLENEKPNQHSEGRQACMTKDETNVKVSFSRNMQPEIGNRNQHSDDRKTRSSKNGICTDPQSSDSEQGQSKQQACDGNDDQTEKLGKVYTNEPCGNAQMGNYPTEESDRQSYANNTIRPSDVVFHNSTDCDQIGQATATSAPISRQRSNNVHDGAADNKEERANTMPEIKSVCHPVEGCGTTEVVASNNGGAKGTERKVRTNVQQEVSRDSKHTIAINDHEINHKDFKRDTSSPDSDIAL